jgi:hypothetical protein
MKNRGLDALTDYLISGAGVAAFVVAASSAWSSKDQGVPHILNLHAVLLTLVGVGVSVAGYALKRASDRISSLEDQLVVLRRKNG